MADPRIWPIAKSRIDRVEVGAVSIRVMITNANRADADLTNDGDAVIYLARGEAARVGYGARLNPKGGNYHIGTNNLWHGEVFAIADTPGKYGLAILEGDVP